MTKSHHWTASRMGLWGMGLTLGCSSGPGDTAAGVEAPSLTEAVLVVPSEGLPMVAHASAASDPP